MLTTTWHINIEHRIGEKKASVVLNLIYDVNEFPVKEKENSRHLKGIILVLTRQRHSGKPIILDL